MLAALNFQLVFIIIILLLCYLTWRKKHSRFYQLLSKIEPIKRTYPLIGHAYLFSEAVTSTTKLCDEFRDLSQPRIIWLGPRPLILLNAPEHLEKVFFSNKCINKAKEIKFFGDMLSSGLLFVDNPKWRRNRKLLNRVFHQTNLKSYIDIFRKLSEATANQLQDSCDYEFDISHSMINHAFDTFFETSLGVDSKKYRKEFLHAVETHETLVFGRILNPIMHIPSVFYNTANGKEVVRSHETYKRIVSEIYDQKFNMYQEALIDEETDTKMLLDFLINLQIKENAYTKDEIFTELAIFITAGYETASTAASFVFIMLGLHKEEQEKLYQEILKVEALHDQFDFKSLSDLTYMEQFINETMRIFPVGPLTARTTSEELDLGDVILPANVSIVINVLGLHRCEKYFKNPLVFDPERFNAEETAKRPRFSYIPFSGGQRDCIGKTFAMLSLKMLFAHIIKEFQISTSYKNIESIKLDQKITLNFTDGYPVTLRKRKI